MLSWLRRDVAFGRRVVSREAGLYRKYIVNRSDRRDAPGEKHWECDYFVLDWNHDPHALAAIRAYIDSCASEYPRLAKDLEHRLALAEHRQRIDREASEL